MIDLKTIVAPTDLSPCSMPAVTYACELAEIFGAELHLLYVMGCPFAEFAEYCKQDYGTTFQEYEREFQRAAEERLNAVDVQPLRDAGRVIRVSRSGFPVVDIPEYVSETTADLLVLGTHGRTGLDHVLTGSVCESVVRRAKCPVMTIRSS